MSDRLDKLMAEVRRDLGTAEAKRVDWNAVDAKLFAHLEASRRVERARFAPHRRPGATMAGVGLLAVAAVAAVIAGKSREPLTRDAVGVAESAGTIVAIEGEGSVVVNAASVGSGAGLSLGDVVETRRAQATVERPGKVSLILERDSRATVSHVHGALVLALAKGAIEAQVVPVAAGEAFAVDVGSSRVAVHGTHLRVERSGDRVVVDLNEGVISVGEAPRVGAVDGTLVNAPAHVEFLATDALGTLTQTHDLAAVRGAEVRSRNVTAASAVPPPRSESSTRSAAVPPATEGRSEPRPTPTFGTKSASAVDPRSAIVAAVRTCMSERPHADNVTVVVNTTLHLDLADDGTVRIARFEPPVAPDVNACAAQSIYKSHFAHGGSIALPIDFTN